MTVEYLTVRYNTVHHIVRYSTVHHCKTEVKFISPWLWGIISVLFPFPFPSLLSSVHFHWDTCTSSHRYYFYHLSSLLPMLPPQHNKWIWDSIWRKFHLVIKQFKLFFVWKQKKISSILFFFNFTVFRFHSWHKWRMR